jgi:hypothetical protein
LIKVYPKILSEETLNILYSHAGIVHTNPSRRIRIRFDGEAKFHLYKKGNKIWLGKRFQDETKEAQIKKYAISLYVDSLFKPITHTTSK